MLPKWMRQAIRDNVMSPEEAAEMYQLCLESEEEVVSLPEHLWKAAERISLWEAPTWPTVQ